MTLAELWHGLVAVWRVWEASFWFGMAVYAFLSRRGLRRRLARSQQTVREQDAAIRSLVATARRAGFLLFDPRFSDGEQPPQRLH